MALKKRGGLGSGMSSLFSSNEIEEKHSGGVLEVDINKITPNPKQPRNKFDDATLMELADSIKEVGVLQPITVKKNGDFYIIIAGERRWRAARIAGLEKIPAIEKDLDELKILEAALIENVQREDLNPMEEAYIYKRLSEEYSLSQEQIAKKVGKSRTVVANAIRLLNLDERVQTFIKENRISNGHGRALIPLDKEQQFELAERIIDEGLSVRQIEELVKEMNEKMPNQNLLYDLSDFFKIMGDGTRIQLLWALVEAEMCVGDLAVLLNMSKSAVSHQLKTLRTAKLIKARKEGKLVFYSLDDDHIKGILEVSMEHICER